MITDLKSPQQQIYDLVFKQACNLGYEVYDYLPAKDAKLPFIYVGEQFDQDYANKSSVAGEVQQTIHIYGSYKQRRQVSTLIDKLKHDVRRVKKTDNFDITVSGLNSQIITDNSTSTTLLHGIAEFEFKFN